MSESVSGEGDDEFTPPKTTQKLSSNKIDEFNPQQNIQEEKENVLAAPDLDENTPCAISIPQNERNCNKTLVRIYKEIMQGEKELIEEQEKKTDSNSEDSEFKEWNNSLNIPELQQIISQLDYFKNFAQIILKQKIIVQKKN